MRLTSRKLIELAVVDEVFAAEIARVEHLDGLGMVRLSFTSPERLHDESETYSILRAKLVVPIQCLVPMGRVLIAAENEPTAADVANVHRLHGEGLNS